MEYCDKDCLILREQYWIDFYDSMKGGYNIAPKAANTAGLYGFKVIQKDEAGNVVKIFDSIQECAAFYDLKEKTIVLQALGVSKNRNNLTIDKEFFPAWLIKLNCKFCGQLFIAAKSRTRTYCSRECYRNGHTNSEEIRAKISNGLMGRAVSEETKKKISLAHKGVLRGFKHSEETKLKIGLASKGRVTSEETRKKLSVINKNKPTMGMLGKKHSEETRIKMSMSMMGKTVTEETRKKISLIQRGKKPPEASLRALAEFMKNNPHPMLGKKHSAETRAKMSESARMRQKKITFT